MSLKLLTFEALLAEYSVANETGSPNVRQTTRLQDTQHTLSLVYSHASATNFAECGPTDVP